jgi:hypothetical protein
MSQIAYRCVENPPEDWSSALLMPKLSPEAPPQEPPVRTEPGPTPAPIEPKKPETAPPDNPFPAPDIYPGGDPPFEPNRELPTCSRIGSDR